MAALQYANWKRWLLLSISTSICVIYCVVMEMFQFSVLLSIPWIIFLISYPLLVATIMGKSRQMSFFFPKILLL